MRILEQKARPSETRALDVYKSTDGTFEVVYSESYVSATVSDNRNISALVGYGLTVDDLLAMADKLRAMAA